MSSLQLFHPYTASWFTKRLGAPTAVQEEAWPAIASGQHTLVSAPTGTGKTLSAFLVFIDRLKDEARQGKLKQELQLIYISPLKSLAGDIRENLRKPLNGIYQEESEAHELSRTPYEIQVAIRTGDTTQSERRHMIKTPPHILITTPESLFLLLTSKTGKEMLSTANAVIIDELHALINGKRGSHLMLSLARLDRLHGQPLQRIGLSATVKPLSLAAEYLCPDAVKVVAPPMQKDVLLEITGPGIPHSLNTKDAMWQEMAATVYEKCRGTRTAIAFCDGRMYSEKLAFYVNQMAGENFARTHHGSLSKEQRHEVEELLREGRLRLLCATSSMELGIDVGEIDLVLQIGTPSSVSSTLQRLGRAGHNPGRVSAMTIYPRTATEGLYCGMTAQLVREMNIEPSKPPEGCFDILAQHLVSMAAGGHYEVDDVMELLPRAYPFRNVSREEVCSILCMLSGDYEHDQDIPVRPRLLYDRLHGTVDGDTYSRMLAVSAGGTIPDKGMFAAKTENGIKIGELDEEYVFEARVGDKFLLGTFAWKITDIQKDQVVVQQTSNIGAQLPFWKGDVRGRNLSTALAFGKIFRSLQAAAEQSYEELCRSLRALGLLAYQAEKTGDFIMRQIKDTGRLPNDQAIILEHFRDDSGNHQLMIHSIFGRPINAPLAILIQEAASRKMKTNLNYMDNDDGILFVPYNECEFPRGLLQEIRMNQAQQILEALLPTTPLFNITFRYNVAHALMMGTRSRGRQPLWVQRLRSAQILDTLVQYEEHPLIRETKRECLEDCWDLPGLFTVLQKIRSGEIRIYEVDSETPSAMSLPLRFQTEAELMYNYAPTPNRIVSASEKALQTALMNGNALPPDPSVLQSLSSRRLPEDATHLHSMLMTEGDLLAGELDIPLEWLEELSQAGRVLYVEPGLWIAAEHMEEYQLAFSEDVNGIGQLTQRNTEESSKDQEPDADRLSARLHIIRRALRYRGAMTVGLLSERYLFPLEESKELLTALCEQNAAVLEDGIYYHAQLYAHAQRETIRLRRTEYKTQPAIAYANLLYRRVIPSGPVTEQLREALTALSYRYYPAAAWETVLLPARVNGYRPDLLDQCLAQGDFCWQFDGKGNLMFYRSEDVDWDADSLFRTQLRTERASDGSSLAVQLLTTLEKRGASFMKSLSAVADTPLLHQQMLELTGSGLVHADSFVPVRQWIKKEIIFKGSSRQLVGARVLALTTGRFELSRPILQRADSILERNFDQSLVICRETIRDMSWMEALTHLRVLEYTGEVRRGYFFEGLSGIQFIRDRELPLLQSFNLPNEIDPIIWLPAIDPAIAYGKSLTHESGRSFLSLPGTLVAVAAGRVLAVFEKYGKQLRVFDEDRLSEMLTLFVEKFRKKQIFPDRNRIVIKSYSTKQKDSSDTDTMKEDTITSIIENALKNAGFSKEMQDYTLYR